MKELRCSPCQRISREYPIYIGTAIWEETLPKIVQSYASDKIVIITDSIVQELYGKEVQNVLQKVSPTVVVSMPAGEKNKTPATYLDLCNKVLQAKVTKKSFIILLGGGVPGNVGGFVASTIMRGLRFAHLPTTVIAQADSTTGGKQGINTLQGKNLLGVFNDPEFVIIDTEFLKTLPKREIRGGIAECIKHALCQDQEFVEYLRRHLSPEAEYPQEVLREIISRTLQAKLEVLRYDPKEINEGKILVYGHTIGHALETLGDYDLTHGEAISLGMMFTALASRELGLADENLVNTHKELLTNAGLPVTFPRSIPAEKLLEQLKYDKKYTKELELVLLNKVGELYSKDGRFGYTVNEEFIKTIYGYCQKR